MSLAAIPISDYDDARVISSLLSNHQNSFSTDLKYSRKILRYLIPSNLGAYAQSINFNLQSSDTSVLTDWSESYLSIPITITTGVATVPSPISPPIAFKSSAMGILQRVVVKTNSNTFSDDNSIAFSAHLRACLNKDDNWLKFIAPEVHYSRDRPGDNTTGLNTVALISNPCIAQFASAPIAGIIDNSGAGAYPGYNKGFHERCNYLVASQMSDDGLAPAFNTTTAHCQLRIPLKAISTFFEALDVPLLGLQLQLQFFLNTPQNLTLQPVVLGSTDVAAQTPTLGGTGTISITPTNPGTVNEPRVYFHEVELGPAANTAFVQKLTAGFDREIRYPRYELYQNQQWSNNVAPGTPFSHPITYASKLCKRLWCLVYPTNIVNSSSWPSVLMTGPNTLTQLQVLVNGKSIFNNPLMTVDEQYSQLKQCMTTSADGDPLALLPFQDFRMFSRILCFDLSRAAAAQNVDPNAAMMIQVSGMVSATCPQNVDFVYILECSEGRIIHFTNGSVSISVSNMLQKS
jgi:hypothetical protein